MIHQWDYEGEKIEVDEDGQFFVVGWDDDSVRSVRYQTKREAERAIEKINQDAKAAKLKSLSIPALAFSCDRTRPPTACTITGVHKVTGKTLVKPVPDFRYDLFAMHENANRILDELWVARRRFDLLVSAADAFRFPDDPGYRDRRSMSFAKRIDGYPAEADKLIERAAKIESVPSLLSNIETWARDPNKKIDQKIRV